MLIESLKKWVEQGCFARELIVTEPHTPASIFRCLVARVCAAQWSEFRVAECRAFSPSNDTELVVASVEAGARNEWICFA